jgi:hypothetical protein
MSSEAPRPTEATDESASLEAVGDLVATKQLIRLGTAADGRHLDYDPRRGEIKLRRLDGLYHVTEETIDLGGDSVRTYVAWDKSEVDVDVDWNEGALE